MCLYAVMLEFLKIAFVISYAVFIDGKSVNRTGQFSYSKCNQALSDVVCERINITKVNNREEASLWPPGPYALPDILRRGCPESNSKGWKQGVMDIQISDGKHIKFKFCVKSRSHPELDKAEWITGMFGIYKAGKTCPKGFTETHRKLNSGYVIKEVTYVGGIPAVVVNNQSDGISITYSMCERNSAEVDISDAEFGMLQTEFSIIKKKDVTCEKFRGTFARDVTVNGDIAAKVCFYIPDANFVDNRFVWIGEHFNFTFSEEHQETTGSDILGNRSDSDQFGSEKGCADYVYPADYRRSSYQDCDVTSPFICEKVLECDGWDIFNKSCYKLFPQSTNWAKAKKMCEDEHSTLLIVEDESEHDFIERKYFYKMQYTWIGASYAPEYDEHRWIDGSAMTINKWNPEPESIQGCVYYSYDRKSFLLYIHGSPDRIVWNVSDCENMEKVNSFICERGPDDVSEYVRWQKYEDKRYYFSPIGSSWHGAKSYCEEEGGRLLIVKNDTERKYIWKKLSADKTESFPQLMHFSMTTGTIPGKGNTKIEKYTWYQLDMGRTLSLVEINIRPSTALQDKTIKSDVLTMHERIRSSFLYCFYDNVKWSFINHEAVACQEEATFDNATMTMYLRHVHARFFTLIFNESGGIPTITSKQYIAIFLSGIPESDSFNEDLGMADLTIKDPQILASSWVPNHPPSAGRPYGDGWCAEKTDVKPWILVDLEVVTVVEGFSIWRLENDPTEYDKGCSSIVMNYGRTSDPLTVYNEMSFHIDYSQPERKVQEFVLINAIQARYIKLELLHCLGAGSRCLMFELRGCKISDTIEMFPMLIYSESVFIANVEYVEAGTIISSIGYPVAGSAQEYIWILRFPEHQYIRIAFSNVFLMKSEHNYDIILVSKKISTATNAIEIDHRYNEMDFVFETGETLMYLTFVSSLTQERFTNRGFQAVFTQEVIPACMSIDSRVLSAEGRKEVCNEPDMILTSMSILNFPFVNTQESWEIHGGNHRSIQLNIMDFYVICPNVAEEIASTFEIIEEFTEENTFCNLNRPPEVIYSQTSDMIIRFQRNVNPRKTYIRKEGFRLQFTTINQSVEPQKDLVNDLKSTDCSKTLKKCYTVISSVATWNEARQSCWKRDEQLVSIHSNFELQFVHYLLREKSYQSIKIADSDTHYNTLVLSSCHIGLERRQIDGKEISVWSDGSPFTYSAWTQGNPSKRGDCTHTNFNIYVNKTWESEDCKDDHAHFFVCQSQTGNDYEGCVYSNADIILMIDASSGIYVGHFRRMLSFLVDLVWTADIESGSVRIGAVTYSTDVEIQWHLDKFTNKKELITAIGYLSHLNGNANTADALRTMQYKMFIPSMGDRPDVPNICILVTDGTSNMISSQTIPQAEDARANGIRIYVIGIGLDDIREAEAIASYPLHQYLVITKNFDQLADKKHLFDSYCSDTTIVNNCEKPALQDRKKAYVTVSGRACQRWDNLNSIAKKDFRQRVPLIMNLTQISNNCLKTNSTGQLWCYPTRMDDHLLEPCLIYPERKTDVRYQSTHGSLFECDGNRKLPSIYRCDGTFHCSDFSDEISCEKNVTWHRLFNNVESFSTSTSRQVDKDQYHICGSKEWIHILARCDGAIDCLDASDEMNCERPSQGCSDFEFTCNDGSCIHNSQVCDSFYDCYNKEDEFCVDCDIKFHCDVEKCIPHELVCNGEKDCEDGNDEKDCDRSVLSTCDEWWELGYHISGKFVLDGVEVFCDFSGVSDSGGKMKISFPNDVDIDTNKLNTRSLQRNNSRFLDLISESECSLQVHTRCPFSSQASVPIHQFDVSPYCQCIVDTYNVTHIRRKRQSLRITNKTELNFSLYESKQCGVGHGNQVDTTARLYNVVSSDTFYIDDRVLRKVVPIDITTGEIICVYDYKPQTIDPMIVCEGENKMIPKAMQCVYDIDKFGVLKGCHSASHLKDCGDRLCPINTVKCPHSFCIPIRFVCDGTIQCPGGEDEYDCTCLESSSREIFILVEDTTDSSDSYIAAVKLAKQFYNANSDIRLLLFQPTILEVESFKAEGLEIREERFHPFKDFAYKKCRYKIYANNFLGKVKFSSEKSSKAIIMIVDSLESYSLAERIWSTAIPFRQSGFMNYHVSANKTFTLINRKLVTSISVKGISVRRWSQLFSNGFRKFPEICTAATRVPCFGGYRCLSSKQCITIEQLCDGIAQCSGNDDEMFCDNICPKGCKCVGYTIDCRGANIYVKDIVKMSMKTRIADFSNNPNIKNALIGDNIRFPLMVKLNLSSCLIKKIDTFAFSHLNNLKWLDIGYNRIKRLPENVFFNLNHLVYLNLDGNSDLSEISPTSFRGLKSLRSFHITNSKLRKISSRTFSYLSLESINISYNEIEEIEDYAFSNISVEKIDFRGNDIKVFNEHIFSEVDSLQELYTPGFKFCCIRPCYLDEGDCYPTKNEFSSCEDLMRHPVLQAVLWLVGIAALLGNVGSIVYRLVYDRERLKIGYGIFVTNLAAADCLMGVYLLMIAVVDSLYRNRYIFEDDKWRNSYWCVTAGVLSTVSSEASVLFLCLITLDRLLVIKYPFGGVRFGPQKAYISCLVSWIIAFALAIIPVIHTSYFKNKFYSRSGVCVALPLTRDKPPGWMYSVTIFVGLNFCTFILVAFGQLSIFLELQRATSGVSKTQTSRKRDLRVARNLILVATTDFLCWFPIGFMGIMALNGYPIPGDVYAWTAVFILPLNSALNPVLYTLSAIVGKKSFNPSTEEQDRTEVKKEIGLAIMKYQDLSQSVCIKTGVRMAGKSIHDLLREDTPISISTVTEICLQLAKNLCLLHESSICVEELSETTTYIDINKKKKRRICIRVDSKTSLVSDEKALQDNIYQFGILLRRMTIKCKKTTQNKRRPDC